MSLSTPVLAAGANSIAKAGYFDGISQVENIEQFAPTGELNRKTGEITVDLRELRSKIFPELEKRGLKPTEMFLEVDGGANQGGQDIPIDMDKNKDQVSYQGLPSNRQQHARIVIKEKGREIHVTEDLLFENLNFPKLVVDHPDPEMTLPQAVTNRTGMDPGFVKLSSQIQHSNTVWTVSGASNNVDFRRQFYKYGAALVPTPIRNAKGQVQEWKVVNQATHETFTVGPNDILLMADAAFSEHHFYWDSHIIAEALAATDPEITASTLQAWMEAQRPDGGIPRETDLKWSPYQREFWVKFGHVRPNPQWFNPPIAGWAAHQLARWNPQYMPDLLPRLIISMEMQREWLRKNHGVYTADRKLLGFDWSNFGSGRDNAPRTLDQGGLAVDLLAQYKIMLDHENEFHLILGQFKEAGKKKAEADKIGKLITQRYYNRKLKWYVDLDLNGHGGYRQSDVLTLAGFWVVMAKVPTHAQLEELIKANLVNPERFGGGPFLPSLSKDSPYFDEIGHYWRGGGWPPDWNLVLRALYEDDHRALASQLAQEQLAAMAMASRLFANGVTPENLRSYVAPLVQQPHGLWDLQFVNKVKARVHDFFTAVESGKAKEIKRPGRDTVFESLGFYRTPTGKAIPVFNVEIGRGVAVHNTRADFGGWGAAVALDAPRNIVGLDAVPAFHGKDQVRWLHALLTEPILRYHQVLNNPVFAPLKRYVRKNEKISYQQFAAYYRRTATAEMDKELSRLCSGYVEISPTFAIENKQTSLRNFIYNGERFDLNIDQIESKKMIRITVKSANPIPIQFNQNWVTDGKTIRSTDLASFSTRILEVGGSHPSLEIPLTSAAVTPAPKIRQLATAPAAIHRK